MRPGARYSISYQALLCGVSMALVLTFQVYWLLENYELKKANFLRQLSDRSDEELQTIMFGKLSGTINIRKGSGDLKDSVSFSKLLNSTPEPDAKTLQNISKIKDQAIDISDISINIPDLDKMAPASGDDSLLYHVLKKKISELKNGKFAVYRSGTSSGESIYPRNFKTRDSKHTVTLPLLWDLNSTMKIHIPELPRIILIKMSGVFVFSFVYLVLSILVIILLFTTTAQKKKLLESKEVFTQNITHELKIPISTLYLITEKLNSISKTNELPEEASSFIRMYRPALDRLSALTDSIFPIARLQQSHLPVVHKPVNLKNTVNTALKQIELSIESNQAQIDTEGVDDTLFLEADPGQLQSVWINLVENSIKYSEKKAQVSLYTRVSGTQVHIFIKDNGKGIPSQYFKEVFQPYFRVPEQNLHTTKGYGLGLSYVQQIIRLHRGKVHIAESGTNGTIIEIILPLHAC